MFVSVCVLCNMDNYCGLKSLQCFRFMDRIFLNIEFGDDSHSENEQSSCVSVAISEISKRLVAFLRVFIGFILCCLLRSHYHYYNLKKKNRSSSYNRCGVVEVLSQSFSATIIW